MFFAIVASALTVSLAPPNADPINQTLMTDVHPIFVEGKLFGCEADFSVVRTAVSQKGTGPFVLNGALAAVVKPGRVVLFGVKLGLVDGAGHSIAPSKVGLIDENATNIDDFEKDVLVTPGYTTSLYRPGTHTLSAVETFEGVNILTAYYTAPGETMSNEFYVDFRVKTFDPTAPTKAVLWEIGGKEFGDCLANLLTKKGGGS